MSMVRENVDETDYGLWTPVMYVHAVIDALESCR